MQHWYPYMDFGVVHPLIYPECRTGGGPVLETLQSIVDDPCFGAVEIAPIIDPEVRERARALIAAAELQVVYLPILPIIIEDLGLGSPDDDARRHAQARLRALLDEAITLDAPLAMLTGPRDPGPGQREATLERLIADLRALCDYADARSRRRRLHLTFENFDREIEKKRLIGPTSETVAMIEAIDRPNIGITIDLSHLPLLGETSQHALSTAAPHLIHAHIGNCVVGHPDSPLYGDFHPRFNHPLGSNGLLEVADYLEQLHIVGYWERARARIGGTPILSMELKASEGESGATLLANGKRVFARAWALATARLTA